MKNCFSIPPPPPSYLSALAIFEHYFDNEAIRSVHVYRCDSEGGREVVVEREFVFSSESYIESCNNSLTERLVTCLPPGGENMPRFSATQWIGEWICIMAFDSLAPLIPTYLPWIIDPSVNPMLSSVPSLRNDLEKVLELMHSAELPFDPTNNTALPDPFPFELDGYPYFQPNNFLGDPSHSSGADIDNLSFLDIANPPLLASADVSMCIENTSVENLEANMHDLHSSGADIDNLSFLDIADPPLPTGADVSTCIENTSVENLEANMHGLQGLNAPSAEQTCSENNSQVAKDPVAPDIEDTNPKEKHRVTKGENIFNWNNGNGMRRLTKPKKFDRASSEMVKNITRSDIEKLYDMPLTEAAKSLGIGRTILKKKCRDFGISVWPFRKINSINKLIDALEGGVKVPEENNRNEAVEEAEERQKKLHLEKEAIRKNPNIKLQEETVKFRMQRCRNAFAAAQKNSNPTPFN